MAKRAKDTNRALFRTSITLEHNQRFALDLVAPGNTSEAVRYLIRYAIQHGALDAFQHRLPPPMSAQVQQPAVPTAINSVTPTVDQFAGWDTDDEP
jgi:hypothetical protein